MQILIITRWQTGATITSEIFNRNPKFAYFYEPLWDIIGDNASKDQALNLHKAASCDISFTTHKWKNWWQTCKYSKIVEQTGLCNKLPGPVGQNKSSEMVQAVSKACRQNQRHVAIKTVRIPDMSYIKDIVSDSKLNVKVLYIVRDPRAISVARHLTEGVPEMELNECDEIRNNLRYWKDPPDWLKGRHVILRYEDFADDPKLMAQKLYDILGLGQVPQSVKSWLNSNLFINQNSIDGSYYWRRKLDFKRMLEIQARFKDVMSLLGYEAITSQEDLKDSKIPTLKKVNYPLMS